MKTRTFLALATTISIFFLSCEKINDPDAPNGQAGDISEAIALETAVEAAERVVDERLLFGSGFLRKIGTVGKYDDDPTFFSTDCVSISSESTDQETLIVLTFSDNESCDDEGDHISGTLKISISSSPENAKGTITYEDFKVNGYVLNGTKTFDVVDSNANGNTEVSLVVDITVETDDRTITKKGSRLVEQTEGGQTDTNDDDVFTMTGSSNYSDTLGNSFTVEIVSPLIKSANCKYITEGIKHYTANGALSVLDYGDGSCDSVAILTKPDGSEVEIELKYRGKGSINID
ncbi:MAG: hypothetical protein ACR2MT_00680 [Aurantibacter sp.]